MTTSWSGPSQEMLRYTDQCIQNLSKLLGLRYKQSGSSGFTSNNGPTQDLYKDLVNALQAQVTLQDMKREWSSWLHNHGFVEELLQHDIQQHQTQPQSGYSQPTYQQQSQQLQQNPKQPEYQQSQQHVQQTQYLYQEQPSSKVHNAFPQSENQPPQQHLQQPQFFQQQFYSQQPQYPQPYQNHPEPQYFHQGHSQQPQYPQSYHNNLLPQYHEQYSQQPQYYQQPQYSQQDQYPRQQQYTQQQQPYQQQQPAPAIWSAEQQLGYSPTAGDTSHQARAQGPGHSRNKGKGTHRK